MGEGACPQPEAPASRADVSGWRPASPQAPRGSPAPGSAGLVLGQAVLSSPRPGLWPLPPELTLSTCSFFSGHSCSNMPCKGLSGSSRRQMADEGWCPGLGGLPRAPGASRHGDRGPRAAPGDEGSVYAGGHAPGRADGPLGTMPTLPPPSPPQEPACRAGAQLLSPPQSQARGRTG